MGDRIKVKYDYYEEMDLTSDLIVEKKVSPMINDTVGIQFWEPEPKGEDGMVLIIVQEVTKYVEE